MYGMFPLAIGELRTPRERGYASTVRSATGTTEIRGIGGRGECPQTSQLSRSRWDYERPLCGHSLRSAATAYDAPLRHSFDAYFRRIIGSHALSFARTMRRRRAPERHDG